MGQPQAVHFDPDGELDQLRHARDRRIIGSDDAGRLLGQVGGGD
jgi:hypothetical protein